MQSQRRQIFGHKGMESDLADKASGSARISPTPFSSGNTAAVPSPARAMQEMLVERMAGIQHDNQAVTGRGDAVKKLPGATRLLIILGASFALWSIIIAIAFAAL